MKCYSFSWITCFDEGGVYTKAAFIINISFVIKNNTGIAQSSLLISRRHLWCLVGEEADEDTYSDAESFVPYLFVVKIH